MERPGGIPLCIPKAGIILEIVFPSPLRHFVEAGLNESWFDGR
jgi:hypothetical protein